MNRGNQLSLLLALAALCATAAGQGPPATATGAPSLRCGGVGDEDQKRMKAMAARGGLLVTFAAARGAYLADVDVEIRRGTQVLAQGRCNGPLMLVDLPQGRYEIAATAQGRMQRQAVTVGASPASLVMRWPD